MVLSHSSPRRLGMSLTIGALTALVGISAHVVSAQSGVVGRVVDSAGQPAPGVSVMMLPASGGQQIQTRTGGDGTYRLENVSDGTYRIDFELLGFEMMRRNHVVVRDSRAAIADVALRVRAICECIAAPGLPPVAERSARVLDSEGRPLPRARVEIVAPLRREPGIERGGSPTPWREVALTDAEGRISFFAPLAGTWRMTVSDSGFRSVTQRVSASVREPVVFRLTFTGSNLPEYERLDQGCGCPSQLFGTLNR